jgi:hypothetical protein
LKFKSFSLVESELLLVAGQVAGMLNTRHFDTGLRSNNNNSTT